VSDVYLGPVPCQRCRHPVSLLDDKRWHDDRGLHVCRPVERPAEPIAVRVIPPPYRQLVRGKRPRPEWECGDPTHRHRSTAVADRCRSGQLAA
jgi:hypothetical protein